MNKKNLIIGGVMLLIIGFAGYKFFYDRAQRIDNIQESILVHWRLIDLKEIKVQAGDQVMRFGPKGPWWMLEPYDYPSNQEALLAAYQMMSKVLADEAFAEDPEKDRFGMSQPMGVVTLSNIDGRTQTLTIGSVRAFGDKIYVKNSEDGNIYVVHKAWAQFLFQPVSTFLNQRIYLGDVRMKEFVYSKDNQQKWVAQRPDGSKWQIVKDGKTVKLKPFHVFSVWRHLQRVKVSDHLVNTKPNFNLAHAFNISTEDDKQIQVSFNEDLSKIYLGHLSTVAKVDSTQVKKVLETMNKVLAGNE